MENIVYQPPIAKTTSALLRNMLLSTDRTRFNRSTTNNCLTISNNNNPYCNYYQVPFFFLLLFELPNFFNTNK